MGFRRDRQSGYGLVSEAEAWAGPRGRGKWAKGQIRSKGKGALECEVFKVSLGLLGRERIRDKRGSRECRCRLVTVRGGEVRTDWV